MFSFVFNHIEESTYKKFIRSHIRTNVSHAPCGYVIQKADNQSGAPVLGYYLSVLDDR